MFSVSIRRQLCFDWWVQLCISMRMLRKEDCWGWQTLRLLPVKLTYLFSASPKCFCEWKLSLPTFLWKEWLYDWRGMLEVCWRVGGNSWREMQGRLKHGTLLSLPPFMWTRWLNYWSGSQWRTEGRGGEGSGCSNPPRNSEDIGGVLNRTSKKNRHLDFLL